MTFATNFASSLIGIEQAWEGCHRFLFGEQMPAMDSDDRDSEMCVAARWIFTTAFLRQLLEIIPYYLELVAKGVSDPPKIEYSEKVVRFQSPRSMQ